MFHRPHLITMTYRGLNTVSAMTDTGGEITTRNLGIVFVDCFRRMITTMIHLNVDVQAIDAFSRSVVDMFEAVEVEISYLQNAI